MRICRIFCWSSLHRPGHTDMLLPILKRPHMLLKHVHMYSFFFVCINLAGILITNSPQRRKEAAVLGKLPHFPSSVVSLINRTAISILFSQTRTLWTSWSSLMFPNSPTLFPWSCRGLCKQGKEEVIAFVLSKIWMQKMSARMWRSCLNLRLIPMCSLKSAQLGRQVKWCSPRAANGQGYDISWNKHRWDTRHLNSSTCSSIVINCPRHRKSAFRDWRVPGPGEGSRFAPQEVKQGCDSLWRTYCIPETHPVLFISLLKLMTALYFTKHC